MRANGHGEYRRDECFQLSEATDAVGLIRRIEGLLRAVPKLLQDRETELAKTTADLPRIDRQLKSAAFPKQERLAVVTARVKELETALQPQPQAQQSDRAVDEADPARHGPESSQKESLSCQSNRFDNKSGRNGPQGKSSSVRRPGTARSEVKQRTEAVRLVSATAGGRLAAQISFENVAHGAALARRLFKHFPAL